MSWVGFNKYWRRLPYQALSWFWIRLPVHDQWNCTKISKGIKSHAEYFTEFGSYTVGRAWHIFTVWSRRKCRTTGRPGIWSTPLLLQHCRIPGESVKSFLMLPVNKWDHDHQRVVLGGITCDSHDYYDSEEHINEVFLPKINGDKEPLYVGFSYRCLPGPDQRLWWYQALPDSFSQACDYRVW